MRFYRFLLYLFLLENMNAAEEKLHYMLKLFVTGGSSSRIPGRAELQDLKLRESRHAPVSGQTDSLGLTVSGLFLLPLWLCAKHCQCPRSPENHLIPLNKDADGILGN